MRAQTGPWGSIIVAALGGCSAGVHVVRQDARGGELSVWGPVVAAHEEMRTTIVNHCGGRYTVAPERTALTQTVAAPSDARRIRYTCQSTLALVQRGPGASGDSAPPVPVDL